MRGRCFSVTAVLLTLLSGVGGTAAIAQESIWPYDWTTVPDEVREALQPITVDWEQLLEQVRLEPISVLAAIGRPEQSTVVHVSPPSEMTRAGGVGVGELLRDSVPATSAVRSVAGAAWAGRITSVIDQSDMSDEELTAWAEEHGAELDTLVGTLDGLTIRRPMRRTYQPICAVIWGKVGEDITACLGFPPRARMIMGLYLGVLEREDDAMTVLSSLSDAELASISYDPLYVIAGELLFVHKKSLRASIWAWKRGANLGGPAEQAEVCTEIMWCCIELSNPDTVRQELIPWVEEALGRPGSESRWDRAIPALLWGYDCVGEPEKAVERVGYWFGQAEERSVPQNSEDWACAKLAFAQALVRLGRVAEAAATLRELIQNGAWLAETAQAELLRLAESHPDLGEVAILPGRLEAVSPEELVLKVIAGEPAVATVAVTGNPTLSVTEATCELGFAQATVGESKLERETRRITVQLAVEPDAPLGSLTSSLSIATNDARHQTVTVPLLLQVLPPVKIQPSEVMFGVVEREQDNTVTVTVSTDDHPFTIREAECRGADFEVRSFHQTSPCGWELVVGTVGTVPSGVREGSLVVRTSLTAHSVQVPIRAIVR